MYHGKLSFVPCAHRVSPADTCAMKNCSRSWGVVGYVSWAPLTMTFSINLIVASSLFFSSSFAALAACLRCFSVQHARQPFYPHAYNFGPPLSYSSAFWRQDHSDVYSQNTLNIQDRVPLRRQLTTELSLELSSYFFVKEKNIVALLESPLRFKNGWAWFSCNDRLRSLHLARCTRSHYIWTSSVKFIK